MRIHKWALAAGLSAAILIPAISASAHGPGMMDGDDDAPYGMMYGRQGGGSGYGQEYGQGYGQGYGRGMGPGYGYGPGMMMGPGYGYGPGMMMGPGQGYGPGMMMGPGYGYGPGMMMGPGYGYGPGAGMPCPYAGQQGAPAQEMTKETFKQRMEYMLQRMGNPNLKLGDVKEDGKNAFTADIVTKDGSLVERYRFDKNSHMFGPVR